MVLIIRLIDKKKMGSTLKRYMQEQGLTARDVQEYLGLACVRLFTGGWLESACRRSIIYMQLSRLRLVPIDA